ncbi:unnamed protein product [Effrenium voratum]|nr:unnamed protein product [Effrenium voratum]
MAAEQEDLLHWKRSLHRLESRAETPISRQQLESSRIGFRDLQTSRGPTPSELTADRCRSATPTACIHGHAGPLSQAAALDRYARSNSACGSYSARCDTGRVTAPTPSTAQPSRLSLRDRSPFDQEEEAAESQEVKEVQKLQDDAGGVMQPHEDLKDEADTLYNILFRRRPPPHDEADDLRPVRSRAAPPGLMKATTQPECELLLSISKNFKAASDQGVVDRIPYGAMPLQPHETTSPPAQLAAPVVRPHNAWCTYVAWVPPASGSDDDDFSYELNVRNADSDHCLLIAEIGQEPKVQLNGLEAGTTYFFQVRACNSRGSSEWSFWSEGYLVPQPLQAVARSEFGYDLEPSTSSDSPHSIKLEWDEPCSQGAPITGYRVQYTLDPADESLIETITSLHRRTFLVVTDLKPSHLYFFRVQALNEVGASGWTNWSDGIATKVVGPDIPSPPKLEKAHPRSLVISWPEPFTCGFRIHNYDVKVACEDPTLRQGIIIRGGELNGDMRKLDLTDLQPMHDYYFQVRTVASTGTSQWSQIAGPYKTAMEIPDCCTDLELTDNEIGKVGLRFLTPETHRLPIRMFVVRWSEDYLMREEMGRLEVPIEEQKMPIGTPITCEVPKIPPGLVLHFEVAAATEAGIGHFSEGTGEVLCHPDKPGEPPAPTCKEKTKASFVIQVKDTTENNGSTIFRYELRYDTNPQMLQAVMVKGPMQCVQQAGPHGARVFEHVMNGLAKRGPYYVQTRCWNSAGGSRWSEVSDPLLLHVSEPSRLAAVTLVKADSPESLIVKYVQAGDLGAKFGGSITEYELRYARREEYLNDPEAGKLGEVLPHEVGLLRWPPPPHGESPPVRVAGLITGRTYVFQVRAINAHGAGLWSFPSEPFKTLPSRPDRPEPVNVAKGALNPFSAKLKMILPESNGSKITGCRLMHLGPNWKNRPKVTDWKELKIVEFDDCEIETKPSEDSDLATDPLVHVWEFTVLHLEPGASYRFKFSCINAVGESEVSDESNVVTTMPTTPDKCTAPFLANEEDAKPYSITFHWHTPHDGGSDILHYTLIWATNMRFQGYKVIDNVTENTYTLDNMEPNMKLYLRVAATNDVGQGKFSDCVPHMGQGVIATIPRVPSTVRELNGEPSETKVGAVVLRWLKPLQDGGCMISRYRVCFSQFEDFSEAKEVGQKAGRECQVTDLKPETDYYFKVAAINSVGPGPYGDVVTIKTLPMPPEKFIPPRQPEPPQIKLVSEEGVDFIKARWVIPETYDNKVGFIYDQEKQTHMITHYSVYLQGGYPSPDVNEHEELKENVPQVRDYKTTPKNGSNVAKFEGLVPGRYYHCILKAFSAAGESPWSWPSDVVRAPPGAPDAAAEVHVVGTTSTSITVTWPSPSGNGECITSFYLRCREVRVLQGWLDGQPADPDHSGPTAGQYAEIDEWWAPVAINFCDAASEQAEGTSEQRKLLARRASVLGGVKHTHVIKGLQPASYYELEVVSENSVGLSGPTLSGEVRTRSTKPGPPGSCVGVGDATINSVKFAWKAASYTGGEDILGYEVRWIPNAVGKPAPTSLDALLDDSAVRIIVGPDCHELVAEGLHPGDAAIPVVRAWTEVSHGDWCRLPADAELEDLSALPDMPAETSIPPLLERTPAEDHRLYSLKASWTCPDLMGRPIQYFKLRLFRADTEEEIEAIRAAGKVLPPPAADEAPCEFTIEKPPNRDWVMGEMIEMHGLHKALTPGTPYVVYVRATSSVGDAKGWGVASLPQTAPPDYPSKPDKPTCPWQWPTALEVHWKEPWLKGSELKSCEFLYSKESDMSHSVRVPHDVAHKTFGERQIHVDGMEYATTYYFRVRVQNAVGWSEWSDISEGFMTGACRPAPPKRPVLEHVDMEQLVFRWNQPNSHGSAIDKYEVFLADQERVAKVPQLVEDLNNCENDQEQKELLEALPCKDFHSINVEEFANRAEPDHIFEGLLGGLQYAVAVRAHNFEGWSDWSPALDDIVSPAAPPEESPSPWMLEATKDTLRVGFSVPYDNGDRITQAEVCWFRISGPMERHIALGGKVTVPTSASSKEDEEGYVTVDVPDTVERAKPEEYGGSWEALLTGLAPGTEYEVQVACINSHGNGPYSIGMRMVCCAGIPDMPGRIRHAIPAAQTRVAKPQQFQRVISDMSQGNLSDLEAPPTPRSSMDDGSEKGELAVEEDMVRRRLVFFFFFLRVATKSLCGSKALSLPAPSAVQSGAVFFKRTQKLEAPEVGQT